MDEKAIKLLQEPADGDMAKIKAKSKLIIALTGHDRTKAYNLSPKVERGHLKTYVSIHNNNSQQKSRKKNNKSAAWSFAFGARNAIPK